MEEKANVKFNNSSGTILCHVCGTMLMSYISTGLWEKIVSPEGLAPQYCENHRPINKIKESK